MPVITEFFKEFPIVYLRRELADWLDAGLTFDDPFPDGLPPISVYYTHEDLLCLVEAAYNYLKELDSGQKQ